MNNVTMPRFDNGEQLEEALHYLRVGTRVMYHGIEHEVIDAGEQGKRVKAVRNNENVTVSRERYETEGYALAMRVLQSDLYKILDDKERAECDEFIRRGQALAQPAEDAGDVGRDVDSFAEYLATAVMREFTAVMTADSAGKAVKEILVDALNGCAFSLPRPAPEPVAWYCEPRNGAQAIGTKPEAFVSRRDADIYQDQHWMVLRPPQPLYTAPPPQEAVRLLEDVYDNTYGDRCIDGDVETYCRVCNKEESKHEDWCPLPRIEAYLQQKETK